MNKQLLALGLCLLVMLGCISALWFSNINNDLVQDVSFSTSKGDVLDGKLYNAGKQTGIFFAGGTLSNQTAAKPFVQQLIKSETSVFTFDYKEKNVSGEDLAKQGVSAPIYEEYKAALTAYKEQSGLADKDIIIIGYGTGGRLALEHLVADKSTYKSVILLSPDIQYNRQESLINPKPTGDSLLDSLSPGSLTQPTLILGTQTDDIAHPYSLTRLYNTLSGDGIKQVGGKFKATTGNVSISVLTGAFHPYQLYSENVIGEIASYLQKEASLDMSGIPDGKLNLHMTSWTMLIIFTVIFLLILYYYIKEKTWDISYRVDPQGDKSAKKLILYKTLGLVGVIPLSILFSVYFPRFFADVPDVNVKFVGILFGFMVVMPLLYRKCDVVGESGDDISKPIGVNITRYLLSLAAVVFVLGVVCSIVFSGFYHTMPSSDQIIWRVVFAVICWGGFYTSIYEKNKMEDYKAGALSRILWGVVQYIPFVFVLGMCAFGGTYTQLISAVHSIIALVLAVLLGRVVDVLTYSRWFTSLCMAVTFQLIIGATAILIQ